MNRAVTAILVVSSFLGGGSTVYSAFQISLPSRTALKVTTDPANVWSWHKRFQLPPSSGSMLATHRERVLVDFNGNGRMDTEDPEVRVTITDYQFVILDGEGGGFSTLPSVIRAWLVDSTQHRWCLFHQAQNTSLGHPFVDEDKGHLVTPIVLTPGSDLFVDVDYGYNTQSFPGVVVNLIGREIVL